MEAIQEVSASSEMEDGRWIFPSTCAEPYSWTAMSEMLGIQPRKWREGGLVCSHQFGFGADMLQYLLQAEVFQEIITTPVISHFYLLVEGKSQ